MDGEERFDYLASCEQSVYQFCVSELKQVFNTQVNQYLLRKFANSFKKDEEGKPRNWKEVEESKIQDLFKVSMTRTEDSLNQFSQVGFPKHITKLDVDEEDT